MQLLRDLGAAIAPQSAWLLIQGIETLSLRIERHVQNAQEIAEWLENHDDVASVNYSGLPTSPWYAAANEYAPKGVGAVLSFELKGGVEAGREFVNSLTLFSHLANIGDVRSLVIHPASTTHSQLTPEQQLTAGVTPGPRAPVARASRTSTTSRPTSSRRSPPLAASARPRAPRPARTGCPGRPPGRRHPSFSTDLRRAPSGARAEAAVDAEHLAGDPVVGRVEEERDAARDVVRLAETAQGMHVLRHLARALGRGEGRGQRASA